MILNHIGKMIIKIFTTYDTETKKCFYRQKSGNEQLFESQRKQLSHTVNEQTGKVYFVIQMKNTRIRKVL